jgi:hypothetical protein
MEDDAARSDGQGGEGLAYLYFADWFEARQLVAREEAVPAGLVRRIMNVEPSALAFCARSSARRQRPST